MDRSIFEPDLWYRVEIEGKHVLVIHIHVEHRGKSDRY